MSTELQPAEAGSMMSCVGSHELGCLTLGVMRPGVRYTTARIYEDVMQLQGDTPVWNVHSHTPYTYFTKFNNDGLVVPATDSSYQLTGKGEVVGKAVAGHMVGLSAQVELAQVEFVGPHAVKGEGVRLPVQNRIAILRELVKTEDKPVNGNELQAVMSTGSKPHKTLGMLAALGVISMETSGKKPMNIYEQGPRAAILPTVGGKTPQSKVSISAVRHMLDSRPGFSFTNTDIAELARQLDPGLAAAMSLKDLTVMAKRTTDYLETRGVLTKRKEKAGGCTVWLNESQLFLASRLLEIFDGLGKPTQAYLDEGRTALEEIMRPESRDVVHQLVSKAMHASTRHQNAENRKTALGQQIMEILDKSAKLSLTKLCTDLAKTLTPDNTAAHKRKVERTVQYLVDQGKVNVTRQGPGITAQRLFSSAERNNKLELVERWGSGKRRRALHRYIDRKIFDGIAAEDIIGELFASILDPRTRTLHLDRDDHAGWIYALTNNKVADFLRRRYRQRQAEDKIVYQQDELEPSFETDAIDSLAKQSLQQVMMAAVKEAGLTPAQMRLLKLELINPEMPSDEAAKRLRGTPIAFRVGRSRLRNQLRPILLRHLQKASDAGLYIPQEFLRLCEARPDTEEEAD